MGGEAIQIADLDTKSKRPQLNLKAVERIIKSKGSQNLPTLVISIGGVARSGKSFLLNLMVNYLSYVEKKGTHVGWETSNGIIHGINWAQSRKAVTRGIWMWNTPYKIKRRDGSEVAVLLVDSQGTGDNRMSDPKLDTQIMYISLELSCFQLLNINQYLTSNELTSLQLCTDYADLGPAAEGPSQANQHLFENLIFVVRNYQSDDRPYGEDPNLFNEILEEGTNEELLKAVRGIKRAFSKITSFTLPYPGQAIAAASVNKKEWKLSDIPEDFLKPTKDLCVDLFSSCYRRAHDIPTGIQLLTRFEGLKFRLESTDLPDIGTPADALQETILYRAYSKALELYNQKFEATKKEILKYDSEDGIRAEYHTLTNLVMSLFCKEGHHEKYGSTVIWRKYQEYLQNKFDTDLEILITTYVREKHIAALAEENRLIQERMEKQQKESAEQMSKLERETQETAARLKETQTQSEAREQANREQLAKITEDMKNAREEDRAWYEREAERYQASIQQEKEARDRAEQLHGEQVKTVNATLERMSREHEAREKATAAQMANLQQQLQAERNRPPPQPSGGGGCTIL